MMQIIIDTRENLELQFLHPEISDTIKQKLDYGDYGAIFPDGSSSDTQFERKAEGDLNRTLTKDYPRFKRELMGAKKNGITLIIIVEKSFTKVLKGYSYRKQGETYQKSGVSIIKTIFSLWARYGIMTVFCKDREEMQNFIIHYYWAEWRKIKANKGLKKVEKVV